MSSNSINVNGGNVSGNVSAGDNNRLSVSSTPPERASAEDLLTALRAAGGELVAAGRSAQDRQEIADELRKILAAVESGQASPATVRSRWGVVQGVLGTAAVMGTALAETTGKITDLIAAVFGAS